MTADNPVPTERPAPGLRGRSHARLFDDGGFFAGANVVWKTKRFAASVLMATSDQDFTLDVDGRTQRLGVVAVRPFTVNQLNAQGVPFVCLDLSPDHAEYHAFAHIEGDGCVAFARERFGGIQDSLREFHAGGMRGDAAFRLFRRIVNLTLTLLPPADAPNPQVLQAKAVLAQHPGLSADALAQACGLTPRRLSHLFATDLGLSLRQYVQWLKIKAALSLFDSGLSLTEIAAEAGFADSAHFCKVWAQIYGASPAYFFNNDEVDIWPRRYSPRFKSLNAANNHERMPTTSV